MACNLLCDLQMLCRDPKVKKQLPVKLLPFYSKLIVKIRSGQDRTGRGMGSEKKDGEKGGGGGRGVQVRGGRKGGRRERERTGNI